VQIGLVLNGASAKADVEFARRAEAAGFDSVFVVEFFNRHGYVRLAAVAAATSRVRVGSGIVNAFTRSPLLHVSGALDIDELSSGRLVLGLGSATRRMNEDWYGVPFSKPAARMRELVELLRAGFAAASGTGFRFEGEHFKLRVPVFTRPHAARTEIPIWIAAVNSGMTRVAGAVADGLVGHPVASRRYDRDVTLPLLRAAEKAAGRPEGSCCLAPHVITSIQENRDHAVRDAKRQIGFYFTTELYHTILDLHGLRSVGEACRRALRTFDIEAMADAIPDSLVDEIAIACTPDEARDRLAQWNGLTADPLLYPPTLGVPASRLAANLDALFDIFSSH
jgi:probable F420-dependent oxidoreductase